MQRYATGMQLQQLFCVLLHVQHRTISFIQRGAPQNGTHRGEVVKRDVHFLKVVYLKLLQGVDVEVHNLACLDVRMQRLFLQSQMQRPFQIAVENSLQHTFLQSPLQKPSSYPSRTPFPIVMLQRSFLPLTEVIPRSKKPSRHHLCSGPYNVLG